MRSFSLETKKLVTAAIAGPLAIIPACVLLEIVLRLFNTPLVPFISGYLFGDGIYSGTFTFAFMAIGLVFYPATLLVGVPTALLLRRFNKPYIGGLMAAPLLIAFILIPIMSHPDLIIVIFYCAFAVSLGCWWGYIIAQKKQQRAS